MNYYFPENNFVKIDKFKYYY